MPCFRPVFDPVLPGELGEIAELIAFADDDPQLALELADACEGVAVQLDALAQAGRRNSPGRAHGRDGKGDNAVADETVLLILSAGAGGSDAQAWASRLLRMYLRHAERQHWQAELLDEQDTAAGIAAASVRISGPGAERLRGESGNHRICHRSPFDPRGRRHTSFAAVEVLSWQDPEEITIGAFDPADVELSFFRASGPGGQHRNKTDSAVRAVHRPSGLIAVAASERSQGRNKQLALAALATRVLEQIRADQAAAQAAARGQRPSGSFGGARRSYTASPYQLVNDHVAGVKTRQLERVLDGELELLEAAD